MKFSPFGRRHLALLERASTAVFSSAVLALVGLSGCASAPADVSQETFAFPSPNSGPGRPELEKDARRHVDDGWQALRRGDPETARQFASRAGENDAARLLAYQAVMAAGAPPVEGLRGLSDENRGYAAAWLTLSVAAEKTGDEALALRAADTGASLWPDNRWIDRSQSLRHRWIDDRITAANDLLDQGEPNAALDTLAPALSLDPANRGGVLLRAKSLIALDELDHAEAVLSALARDREVVLLSASIAESRGDSAAAIRIYSSLPDDPESILLAIALAEQESNWQTAMDLYSLLPDGHPEKVTGLRAAKLRWRVSVMPAYVREALSTSAMNRSDLAIVVVTLAPAVETLPSNQVPLMSDIVDMPSQREIITAARLGLIDVDRLEHRFEPLRRVTEGEVRAAITRLGSLLDKPTPTWCGESATEPCISFTDPVAGEQVAEIVIEMVAEETG